MYNFPLSCTISPSARTLCIIILQTKTKDKTLIAKQIMTKKIFTLVTLMLIAIGGWAQETPTEKVSVFLTAGQSNTAGRCMNENLPDYIKTLGAANDGAYKYCKWSDVPSWRSEWQ